MLQGKIEDMVRHEVSETAHVNVFHPGSSLCICIDIHKHTHTHAIMQFVCLLFFAAVPQLFACRRHGSASDCQTEIRLKMVCGRS